MSSLGIADLRMDEWGVDLVVSGSQKGLMLPPGLSFCALSEKAWGHVKASRLPKYYFDLATERKFVARNECRFTPAVSIFVGLREVLKMLEAEGLAGGVPPSRAPGPGHPLGRRGPGLELFAKASPSPALTAVVAPRGLDSEAVLVDLLRPRTTSRSRAGRGR